MFLIDFPLNQSNDSDIITVHVYDKDDCVTDDRVYRVAVDGDEFTDLPAALHSYGPYQ